MRKMKRTISMILCLAMLFVAMPIPSLAEGEEAPAPAEGQAPEGLQDQAAPQAKVQSDSQAMDQAETMATGQTETQATVQSEPKETNEAETTATNQSEPKETNEAETMATDQTETTAADPVDANGQAGEDNETEPNANGTSGDKSNKTATPLDDQNETEITLTFPGKQDILGSDIVFVLDKSGASAEKDIFKQAKGFLEEIKTNAEEKGIPVRVGVVLFNYVGNIKQKLTDVTTGYDDILKAMNSSVSMGTNMHAGLLAAKEMLDADTEVVPKNKHVILISDGATYLYCNNGDYTKAYTRSFGDPKKQNNPAGQPYANGTDRKGGIWEYQSREYNLRNDWKKFNDGTTNFIFSYAMRSPDKLGEYLEYYRQQDQDTEKNWAQYEYEYNFWSAKLNKRRETTPIDINAPANIDIAFMRTDDTFQAMVDAGYDMKVYFKNAADFDGTVFLQYLARESNKGKLNTDFQELQKEIIDRIAKGSKVEDVVGKDFDFIDDPAKISLSVGGEKLDVKKIADGQYGFGQLDDGSYRFVLTHTNESDETLTLDINETIFPNKPVELKYHEKLVNIPTDPGKHILKTNEKATLYPKDGNGKAGDPIPFPVPTVTKSIEGSTPSTDLVVTFDGNGGTIHTDSPDGKAIVRKFVRYGEGIVILGAPEREGYKFLYWQDADGQRYNPGENYVVKDNHVFVAQWEEDKPQEKPQDKPQEKPALPRIEVPRLKPVVTVKIPKAGV